MGHEHLKIDIYSHHFVCKVITPRGKWLCSTFAKQFIQYGLIRERGRYTRAAVKVFATTTDDRVEFRFHINCLNKFKEFLSYNYVDGNQLSWKEIDIPISEHIDFKVKDIFTPRGDQPKAIEYLLSPIKNKLLSMQTGKGKGVTSLFAIEKLSKRVIIILRPQFMEKWADEIVEKCDISEQEILQVRGSNQLMALLELGKQGQINEKVIIISNKTIQNWFKAYEKYRNDSLDLGYACYPHELYKILNAGIRLVDEVHMDIHLQCKIDLYTHVEESISLSATLLSDDPFISKMQDMLYPKKDRYDAGGLDKYIDSFGVIYALSNPALIRTSEYGSSTYSHMAYEKSILRNKSLTTNYCELVDTIIRSSFLHLKREKKKLAVYAASIDMCTILTKYFKLKYPNLDIRRYCENDPYENLLEPDIRFTTILSAGVGHDIQDLTTVIMTTAVNSTQANIQTLGRLRKLPDNHAVQFYFFSCKDIPKHMEYHQAKEEMLHKRAKSYKKLETCIFI